MPNVNESGEVPLVGFLGIVTISIVVQQYRDHKMGMSLNRVLKGILNILLGFVVGLGLFHLGGTVAEFLAEWAGIAIVYALPLLFLILILPFLALAPLFLASVIRGSPGMILGGLVALFFIDFHHDSGVQQWNNLADDIIARHPELESRAFAPSSRPLDVVEFDGYGCSDECRRVLQAPQFKAVIMRSDGRPLRIFHKVTGDACLAPELVESLLEFAEAGYGFACAELITPKVDEYPDALIVLTGNDDAMKYTASPDLARYYSGFQAGLVERINGKTRLLGHWFYGEIKSDRETSILDLTLGQPETKRVGQPFNDSEFLEAALDIPPRQVKETSDELLDQSLLAIEKAMAQPEYAKGAERTLLNLLSKLGGGHDEVILRHLNAGEKSGYTHEVLFKALRGYGPSDLAPYEGVLLRALHSGNALEVSTVLDLVQDGGLGTEKLRAEVIAFALSDEVVQDADNHAYVLRAIFAAGKMPVEAEARNAALEKLRMDEGLEAMQAVMLLSLASGGDRDRLDDILASIPLVTYGRILAKVDTGNSYMRGWRIFADSFDPNWNTAEIDLAMKQLPLFSAESYAAIKREIKNYSFRKDRPELREQLKAIAAARTGSTQ